jgi:uncharacterized protein YxeA
MNWHRVIVIIIILLLFALGGLFVMTNRVVPDSSKSSTITTSKIDLVRKAKEQTSQLREERAAKLRHFHKTTKTKPVHHKAKLLPKPYKSVKKHHEPKIHPKKKVIVRQHVRQRIVPRRIIRKPQPAPIPRQTKPKPRPQTQIPATCIQWSC